MKKLFFASALFLAFAFVGNANDESLPPSDSGNCQPGGVANVYCPYWDVEYKVTGGLVMPSIEITCKTGGSFKCEVKK